MDPFGHNTEVVLRLIAAALCGSIIGWNREREDKPAGLHTHMLVSIGAASFTLVMLDLIRRYPGPEGGGDPTRIIQEIATGIGFLGMGSIVHTGGRSAASRQPRVSGSSVRSASHVARAPTCSQASRCG